MHARRAEAGAELQIRHAAIEHGGEQVMRITLVQITPSVGIDGNFLDESANAHRLSKTPHSARGSWSSSMQCNRRAIHFSHVETIN
jgi:hypothetical protein